MHAAALLHDTGYAQDAASHHKRSRDIILGSKLRGCSPRDLAIVACVARYHRKALPDPSHKVYRDLDPTSQALVNRLAALLRIADGLDRSHTSATKSLRITRAPDAVHITVKQDPPSPMDIEAAQKKADLFERTFGLPAKMAAV